MKLDLRSIIAVIVLAVTTAVICAGVTLLIYASFKFILPA